MTNHDIILRSLRDRLEFLYKDGFEETASSVKKSRLVGLVSKMTISRGGIIVDFSVAHPSGDLPAAVSVTVEDAGTSKFFSLDSFLKWNNKYQRITSLPGEEISNFINRYMFFLEPILRNELRDILLGLEWMDVPQYWGEYK